MPRFNGEIIGDVYDSELEDIDDEIPQEKEKLEPFDRYFLNELGEFDYDLADKYNTDLKTLEYEKEDLYSKLKELAGPMNKECARIEAKTRTPLTPEQKEGIEGYDEYMQIQKRIWEIDYKEIPRVACAAGDELRFRKIDRIGERSGYQASKLKRELEKIIRDGEIESAKKLESERTLERYEPPMDSIASRRISIDTKIEMALGGADFDRIGDVVQDYEQSWEGGDEYYKKKDNLLDKLDQMTYEEALSVLEKGYENGKYSDENYQALKRTFRIHYGI